MGNTASSIWNSCANSLISTEKEEKQFEQNIQTCQPIKAQDISFLPISLQKNSNSLTELSSTYKCQLQEEPIKQPDNISEISSEGLTEFEELLHVPFETELEIIQEVLSASPSFTCLAAVTSLEGESKLIQTSDVQISSAAENIFDRSLNSSPDIDTERAEEHILVETMETIDTSVSEQLPVDQHILCQTLEGLDINTATLSTLVDQLQAPPDDEQKEASPEDIILSNGSDSMHDSTESDRLEDVDTTETPEQDDKVEQTPKSDSKDGTKGKSKEEKKSKKKEDKTIEHILRALNSLHSTEEKLAALCKKYADLHEEHRTLQTASKQNQRKLTVVTREKDQLQSEHTKAVMAKSKLEGLCRELQKHNQVIRQESLQRAREEDEKRKEISSKFQSTITEIQQQMQDHHERNTKLREENQDLAGKLKSFIEQYETREKQVETILQHREIEQKLADAKLQKADAILKEEQERSKKEKELLLLQATEAQKKSILLEAQLGMYKERYEEFQSTINKSNEMFQKFKTEMDKMTKKIKKQEKDGAMWKSKWENANKALLEMAEEKTVYDKEKPSLLGKIQKLESLCRAMQAERLGRKVMEASLDPSKLEEAVSMSQQPSEQPQIKSDDKLNDSTSTGEADSQQHLEDDVSDKPSICDNKTSDQIIQLEASGGSEPTSEQLEPTSHVNDNGDLPDCEDKSSDNVENSAES